MENHYLLILFAILTLLIRIGQTLYTSGISRSKNAVSAMARCIADACLAILAFWAIGAAIVLHRPDDAFGIRAEFLLGWNLIDWLASTGSSPRIVFLAIVMLISTGAVVGSLIERSRFLAGVLTSLLLGGIILPVTLSWTTASTGWLHKMKFIDTAGAASLHFVAGIVALVGAKVLGPREGKYHRDGSASMIPGHSVPLAATGTLLIFAGWLAYVLGFALLNQQFPTRAALHVLLAAAAGGASAMLVSKIRYGKVDFLLAMTGILGALVAITGIAGTIRVGTIPPILIGAIAGAIVPLASITIDLIARIDDPAATIAIHGVGGLWGAVAAGLFFPGNGNDFPARLKQIGVQLTGVLAIAVLTALLAAILFTILKSMKLLRVKEADEFDGLDLAEHDIGAYPDFQQTTIKSYHLREA